PRAGRPPADAAITMSSNSRGATACAPPAFNVARSSGTPYHTAQPATPHASAFGPGCAVNCDFEPSLDLSYVATILSVRIRSDTPWHDAEEFDYAVVIGLLS